jgi:hypothetical protein
VKNTLRAFLLRVLAMALLVTAPLAPVHAVIVGTEQAMGLAAQADARTDLLAEVRSALQREDVQKQLVELGVDPQLALERIGSLTPDELAALDGQLDDLPAGGSLLAVLGVLLVVLIVLDLVGVTNVFAKL